MFELHCYVCVAILATCREYVCCLRRADDRTLEELDGSEAKLMLLNLPPMDVDRVGGCKRLSFWLMGQLLQDAANLRVSYPLPRAASLDE